MTAVQGLHQLLRLDARKPSSLKTANEPSPWALPWSNQPDSGLPWLMPICQIDHPVVTVPLLEAGAAPLRRTLNVELAVDCKQSACGPFPLAENLDD